MPSATPPPELRKVSWNKIMNIYLPYLGGAERATHHHSTE